MKESTQDIDLHARGTACLNANGLNDIIWALFGSDPNALMALPMFIIWT